MQPRFMVKSVLFCIVIGSFASHSAASSNIPMITPQSYDSLTSVELLPDYPPVKTSGHPLISRSVRELGIELRGYLNAGNHTAITNALTDCLSPDVLTAQLEQRCMALLANMATLEQSSVINLGNWYREQPASYLPLMLLGRTNENEAWSIRGHELSSKTPAYAMFRFNQLMKQSAVFYEHAQKLRPELPYAYTKLVSVYGRLGKDYEQAADDWLEKGLNVAPTSFSLSEAYIQTIVPRWGGSYQQLYDYWNAIRYLAEADPFYLNLLAQIESEKADELYSGVGKVEQNRGKAVELYHAISAKGYVLQRNLTDIRHFATEQKDFDLAEQYFLKLLDIDGDSYNALNSTYCYCGYRQQEAELSLHKEFTERFPFGFYGWMNYGRLLVVNKQYQLGLDAYEKARAIRPVDASVFEMINYIKKKLNEEPNQYFRSMAYHKDVVTYFYPAHEVLESVHAHYENNVYPTVDEAVRPLLKSLMQKHMTMEFYDGLFRNYLDSLDWSDQEWVKLAAFMSHHYGMPYYNEKFTLIDLDSFQEQDAQQMFTVLKSVNEQVIEQLYNRVISDLNVGKSI